MVEMEREVLATDHAEIGSWLARSWNLPEKLIEPIAFHHHVDKSVEHRTCTAVVHLADVLVKGYGFGSNGGEYVPFIQSVAWKHLGLSEAMLGKIIEAMEDELMSALNFSVEVEAD